MSKKIMFAVFIITCLFCFNISTWAAPAVVAPGKKVKIHYTMKSDGKVVGSSHEKGPVDFVDGKDPMMPGIEKAIQGLKAGDKKSIKIPPQDAFGTVDPQAMAEFPKTRFPEKDLQVGMVFTSQNKDGKPMTGTVKEVKAETVVLDFNHPLAGKTLEVDVEVLEVS
jgi:FKBP-type peptidyl-prolyl cis-trans isomerase SlyD